MVDGVRRQLGSTDYCQRCGAAYTVRSGRQKFCKECALESKLDSHRKSIARSKAQRDSEPRPPRLSKCVVCGATFLDTSSRRPTLSCSPECARVRQIQQIMTYKAANRDHVNAQSRKYYQQRKEKNEED